MLPLIQLCNYGCLVRITQHTALQLSGDYRLSDIQLCDSEISIFSKMLLTTV